MCFNEAYNEISIDVSSNASGNVHEAQLVGDGQSSQMLINDGLSKLLAELITNVLSYIVFSFAYGSGLKPSLMSIGEDCPSPTSSAS